MLVDIASETINDMVTNYMGIAEKYFPEFLTEEQISFIVETRASYAAEFISHLLTAEQIDSIVKRFPLTVRYMQDKLTRTQVEYVTMTVSEKFHDMILGNNLIYQHMKHDKSKARDSVRRVTKVDSPSYIPPSKASKSLPTYGVYAN